MPTITKTKRYQELVYRHLKLIQLYGVVSELRLHTNKAVDPHTSKYYHNKLYVWGSSGPFLTAGLESMMQVFYIELDGFVGAFWDLKQRSVRTRKNEHGSLAAYLYDGTRATRKKSALMAFEALLKHEADSLEMINNLRGKLAHFRKLDERSAVLVPGDAKTREILDRLAEVIHLLGYQRGNEPHYMKRNNDASESTQQVIDKLVASDERAEDNRKVYLKARNKWFGG
jgi:hypothetical protein